MLWFIREQKLKYGLPNNDDAEQGQKSTRFMTLNWLKTQTHTHIRTQNEVKKITIRERATVAATSTEFV